MNPHLASRCAVLPTGTVHAGALGCLRQRPMRRRVCRVRRIATVARLVLDLTAVRTDAPPFSSQNDRIPLAKSGQAARAAKREVRVLARGTFWNQSNRRSMFIAAAVASCCRWVLARSRTMTLQALLLGQSWPDPTALWAGLDARRTILNAHIPCRALGGRAPLEVFPQTSHTGRIYRPEWEVEMFDLNRVYTYLSTCRFFRRVAQNGSIALGGAYDYINPKYRGR